jgi:hypothetical protein
MRRRARILGVVAAFACASCNSTSGPSGPDAEFSGMFWSRLTVPDPGCVQVEQAEVCGPSHVDRIDLIEESTAEILGECSFAEGDTTATQDLAAGYKFWCTRAPAAEGGTEVTLYSKQANLPAIRAYLVRTSDGLPMWEVTVPAADALNAPDGSVLADPYARTDLEFAGFKKLVFTTKADKDYDWMRQEALLPLQEAGYEALLHSFEATSPGFVADIGVYQTLDGRALLEEEIIEARGWKVRPAETRGNLGTYEFRDQFIISATPIFVTDIPTSIEKQVSGNIAVQRNDEEVVDARVTVNGKEVPHWASGLYDVGEAGLSGLGPGSSITIEVTPKDSETPFVLNIDCPPPIEFSSPQDGATIDPDQELSVSWSPGIPYDAMRIAGGPILGIFACYTRDTGGEVSALGHGEEFVSLEVGQTSQSISVDSCRRYLLELQYPGEQVTQTEDGNYLTGYCSVRHRIWLWGPE